LTEQQLAGLPFDYVKQQYYRLQADRSGLDKIKIDTSGVHSGSYNSLAATSKAAGGPRTQTIG